MVFENTYRFTYCNTQRFTVFVKFLYFTENRRVSSLIGDVLFLLLLVAPHSIVFCDT